MYKLTYRTVIMSKPNKKQTARLGIGSASSASTFLPTGDFRTWSSQLATAQTRITARPAMAATGTTPVTSAATAKAARKDAPKVNVRTRGALQAALAAAADPTSRQAAMDAYNEDVCAPSAKASRTSTWSTWCRIHEAWFGPTLDPLPLDAGKIRAVAAAMKAGGYSSFANYASRAKAEHIEQYAIHQVPWTNELRFEMAKAYRSVTRGSGPGRQSHPLDILAVSRLSHSMDPCFPTGPVNPTGFCILGGFFLTREIEISLALYDHIQFNDTNLSVSWNLPASKTDVRALGEHRSWGCICDAARSPACPYHTAKDHIQHMQMRFPFVQGTGSRSLPLFPNESGGFITKNLAVRTIQEMARAIGDVPDDNTGIDRYGGHSLRTGGAHMLAATGLDSVKIQALARWRSPMVAHYAGLAPLKAVTEDFKDKASASGPSVRNNHNALLKQLESMANNIEALLLREAALEMAIDDLKTTSTLTYIMNAVSLKWHLASPSTDGTSSATWKSPCGWHYGVGSYTTACRIPDAVCSNMLCERCLPELRSHRRLGEAETIACASSSE